MVNPYDNTGFNETILTNITTTDVERKESFINRLLDKIKNKYSIIGISGGSGICLLVACTCYCKYKKKKSRCDNNINNLTSEVVLVEREEYITENPDGGRRTSRRERRVTLKGDEWNSNTQLRNNTQNFFGQIQTKPSQLALTMGDDDDIL